jgi:hypothetical protein
LTDAAKAARQKWRPSLSLVVFLVLTAVLSLPLFCLYFLKLYQNELIQQTESELIAQSAALAAVFEREISVPAEQGLVLGVNVPPPPQSDDGPYQPIWPKLELADQSVLLPRPAAQPPSKPADPAFVALGARMAPDLVATQNVARRPAGSRRSAAGPFQRGAAGARFQARCAAALFHQPRHRRAGVHRDAGDRARAGRGRGLRLAHAEQCLQISL